MKILTQLMIPIQIGIVLASLAGNVRGISPQNDNLSQATVLAGNEWSTVGTTVDATLQVDDGEEVDNWNVNYSTVWYRWTAPATGAARVDFRNSVSGVQANIYLGPVDANFDQLIRIAEFDTIDDYYDQAVFPVMQNLHYYIQVGEYYSSYSAQGSFTMSLLNNTNLGLSNLRPDVAHWRINDRFENAILLSGKEISQIVYSWNATAEVQEPYTDIDDPTLWWSWVAPDSGTLTVNWKYYYSDDSRGVFYQDEEPIPEIFTGTRVDLLSVHETSYDGSISVIKGQKYYFRGPARIWSSVNKAHLAVMELKLYVPPPAPPPIQFKFGSGTYSVNQTSGSIRIPISYTGTPQYSQVWLEYNTEGITGTSGTHYAGTGSSVLNFSAETKIAHLTIPIYYSGSTTNKTFRVNMASLSEGIKASPSSAVVTIKAQSGLPAIDFNTKRVSLGSRVIYGKILNVPSEDIMRVTLRNQTNIYKVSGKTKWKSPTLRFTTKGTYKFTATAMLRNKSKITKTIYIKAR